MPSGFSSFDEWKAALCHWCQSTYGVHPDDLPDCDYRTWYEDGVSYQESSKRAVEMCMGSDEEEEWDGKVCF